MANLLHFTKSSPGHYQEFLILIEGNDAAKETTVKEYEEGGWALSGSVAIDDDDLGGLPTERELWPQ